MIRPPRLALLLVPLLALAACGDASRESDGAAMAGDGEIQSLADAEAMLATRDEAEADPDAGK